MHNNDFGRLIRVAPGSGREGEGSAYRIARHSSTASCVRPEGCTFPAPGCKHECLFAPSTRLFSLVQLPGRTVVHVADVERTRALCGHEVVLGRSVDLCASTALCRNCVTQMERPA